MVACRRRSTVSSPSLRVIRSMPRDPLRAWYDPKRWEEETEDYFVLKNGKLPVDLTPRA